MTSTIMLAEGLKGISQSHRKSQGAEPQSSTNVCCTTGALGHCADKASAHVAGVIILRTNSFFLFEFAQN
jgi:hypothetical protein